MRLKTVILLLSAPLILLCSFQAAKAQERPIVCGLVIGVSHYQDASLPTSVINVAERFRSALTNAYRGASVTSLLQADATVANVNQALFNLTQVPPGSLIVVYFVGHGNRVFYNDDPNSSDLFLLLYNDTTMKDFAREAIRIDDVISSISRTKRTTAMIFLDCCFSGGNESIIDIPDQKLQSLNLRAFLLSSSAQSEETEVGVFTKSLLQVWDSARESGAECLLPSQLANEVWDAAGTNSHGFMHPQLVFGADVQRCFAELDEPSSLLCLEFTNGCRYPLEVHANGIIDRVSLEHDKAFYVRQVAKRALEIQIYGEGNLLAWKHSFTVADLQSDYVVVPIGLPAELADNSTENVAKSKFNLAQTLENYGVSPGRMYTEAAGALYSAGLDNSVALAKVQVYAPKDDYLQSHMPLLPALLEKATPVIVTQAAAANNVNDYMTTLEEFGKFGVAAGIATNRVSLLSQVGELSSNVISFYSYRAGLDLKASGNFNASAAYVSEASKFSSDSRQHFVPGFINKATRRDVRQSYHAFPLDYDAWTSLALGKSFFDAGFISNRLSSHNDASQGWRGGAHKP